MKITKYPQSCILIETKGKKILIDPGNLDFEESFIEEWKNPDTILITHKHADHCNVEAINKIITENTKVYTTKEVLDFYSDLSAEVVKEGDVIDSNEIKIEVVKAVHGYVPLFKQGKGINENVGYIIDDGDKRAYHTSDSICFENDYKCDVLFIPVVGHIVMGPWEAAMFAKETGASLVIPVHYDHPRHPMDKELVEKEFSAQDLNYKFLENKESVEI